MPRLRFHLWYFLLFLLLLAMETGIALFINDDFIRPYIGDVLVVVLLYCFLKSFAATPVLATAAGVLVFAFAVEALQYFRLIEVLGLQHSRLARIIIGTYYSPADLLAYTAGFLLILVAEYIAGKHRTAHSKK